MTMILDDEIARDDSPEAAILRHIFNIPYTGEDAPKPMPRFKSVPFIAEP